MTDTGFYCNIDQGLEKIEHMNLKKNYMLLVNAESFSHFLLT